MIITFTGCCWWLLNTGLTVHCNFFHTTARNVSMVRYRLKCLIPLTGLHCFCVLFVGGNDKAGLQKQWTCQHAVINVWWGLTRLHQNVWRQQRNCTKVSSFCYFRGEKNRFNFVRTILIFNPLHHFLVTNQELGII